MTCDKTACTHPNAVVGDVVKFTHTFTQTISVSTNRSFLFQITHTGKSNLREFHLYITL